MPRVRVAASTLLAIVLSFGGWLFTPYPAQAAKLPPAPIWGACGVSTDPEKLVHDFGSLQLRCGGPKYSSKPTSGYRHILKRHKDEFEALAALARLNWRDLAHWAIHYNLTDPDHVAVDGNTGCRDRILSLHDKDGRRVVEKRFKLIYNAVNGRIVTVYPDKKIC